MLRPFLGTLRFLRDHPLTADQPARALWRYLRWQVGSRVLPGPVVVDFVNDARLLVRPGMTGATGNVYAGLHEFDDMAFLLHALRPNDSFVDIGANVGSYTVLAAKAVGARVLAFEPVPETYAALTDNIQLNHVEARVEARQVCVGRTASHVRLTTRLDCMNHVLPDDGAALESSVSVPQVRLDDALAGAAPYLIKLDVEGYELEALGGAAATLADKRLCALIMEVNESGRRYGRSDQELIARVTEHGFERVLYAPFARELRAYEGEVTGGNAIFVRDRADVSARVKSAQSFRVLGRHI
jgi:FkbM family methyltransferase